MSKEAVKNEVAILQSEEALECALAIQGLALDKIYSVHWEADKEDGSPALIRYFCQGELVDYLKMMRGAQILTEQAVSWMKEIPESL